MRKKLTAVAGLVPAIIFPAASLLQLMTVVQSPNLEGLSVPSWICFATANICLYVYMEKYSSLPALSCLLTAAIQFSVAIVAGLK